MYKTTVKPEKRIKRAKAKLADYLWFKDKRTALDAKLAGIKEEILNELAQLSAKEMEGVQSEMDNIIIRL